MVYQAIHGFNKPKSKYEVYHTLECIRELVDHSAQWKPNDASEMNSVRRTLYGCEPAVTVELLHLFVKNDSASRETMAELLQTPRMKQHLLSEVNRLRRLNLELSRDMRRKNQVPGILSRNIFLAPDHVWPPPPSQDVCWDCECRLRRGSRRVASSSAEDIDSSGVVK